jgi:outer membrane protein assembly factor BamB
VFGDDLLVAFTGLDGRQWELVGAAISGPDAGRVLWTAELPLGSQLPSTIAVAGELAVLELDGRVFAVDPRNGTVLWNATSPCSLGDPRMVDTREAFDFVYLVCNELSGDSTIIALSPEDGSPAWTLSTSSLAAALVPVRAAAARDGVFYYADTGSNITALRSEDGALLWRLDVSALVPSTLTGASVTHLLLTNDVLLIREYSAGQSFSAGPYSYLALQLNHTAGSRPSLLWAADSPESRDRLPPGVGEASPISPPALLSDDELFFYWSATAPPLETPLPTTPTVDTTAGSVEGAIVIEANGTGVAETRAADGATSAADKGSLRQLLAAATQLQAEPGAPAPVATKPLPLLLALAPAPAADLALNGTAVPSPIPVAPPVVPPKSEGVGLVAPEGFVSVPVLKARSVRTGEEAWSLELQPISGPSAAGGSVAVVTPDGLQVLDAASGQLRWSVEQRPISIYTYAPALIGGDAVAMKNCLNTLSPSSLCVYTRKPQPAAAPTAAQAPAPAAV